MTKALLVFAGLAALAIVAGVAWLGPRNTIGLIRYGRSAKGRLKPGDRAVDVPLVALDGISRRHLSDFIGERPLVVVLGSFT